MRTAPKYSVFPVIALVAMGAGALTGCASDIGANSYERAAVGSIARVEEGTVVSSRAVMVEGGKSWIGPAVGAVLGGALGSTIGEGDAARTVGVVGGAAAGGYAGSKIEQSVSRKPGYAYTVRLKKTGEMITIVQGGDIAIANGSAVYVEYGERPRVVPR